MKRRNHSRRFHQSTNAICFSMCSKAWRGWDFAIDSPGLLPPGQVRTVVMRRRASWKIKADVLCRRCHEQWLRWKVCLHSWTKCQWQEFWYRVEHRTFSSKRFAHSMAKSRFHLRSQFALNQCCTSWWGARGGRHGRLELLQSWLWNKWRPWAELKHMWSHSDDGVRPSCRTCLQADHFWITVVSFSTMACLRPAFQMCPSNIFPLEASRKSIALQHLTYSQLFLVK